MEAYISLVGSDLADLESLHGWLCQERGLAGKVKFVSSGPRDGELGALAEALVVAVGSGGLASVLASSLKAWVSLPRRSAVRIRVRGADGRATEIAADGISEQRVDDLVRQALGFVASEE